KTSRFKRPRAPVLQILWGIVTGANIDYAKRIWEEFTQSIHTFIEDKRNLSRHTSGKKRATLIVIPSVRFTKLIIHHLQRKHRFHPRPESLFLDTSRTTDKPAKAKRIKRSVSRKTRQSIGSPKSMGESEAEEVPAEEPQVVDEDANFQKAVDESMKDAYALPKGSQDEGQAGPDPNAQAEGQMGSDTGAQAEGQAGSNPEETFESQAGSNPYKTFEGQAGPDPGNAEARVQSTSSPVVHAGSDREHMDIDVANVSPASGSQVTPPPPPPTSTNQDSPYIGSATPSPAKTAATTKHQAWSTTDVTLKPLVSLTPKDLDMDEAMEERPTTPEPAWSIRSSDVPTGDITTFMDWFCKRRGITELKPQDMEGPAYEIVKVFHPDVIHLQYQMEECHKLLNDSVDDPILRHNISKSLPLGGPPRQVTIQSDFFFNKDLEYLRYGSKGRRPVLSISKMKAAYYSDAGLEQMVPDQFWIEEECKYDIAAMYGISHWAVIFWDKYGVQMMMRFNEIHKFSDGTLQQIVKALDYQVKQFRINRMNLGLNTRYWTRNDVDRCNTFMFAIQRCLKTRRIFRNLESFVGGRVRDGDYRLLKRTD
nr:hypothetical protein [Tanacetum cinerariifolium]